MADIYDLVQQSLARSQGGRNQFYDPTADIAMQIPGMIKQQRDVQMVEDKSTIGDIEKLITSANSEQALNNAQDTISNFSPSDASLNPAHQTLQNLIASKRSNFKKGKNSLSEVAGNLDVYEDYTEDEIRGWDIKKLKDEITRVADINDSLVASKQGGFKYGDSKVTIDRAGRAVGDYYGKLQSTMQALATEGKITDEEANAIFFGDFDKVKAESLANSKAEITAARKNITTYQNKLAKEDDDDFLSNALAAGVVKEGATKQDVITSYQELLKLAKNDKKFHVSKYNAWSRSPYASEEEKLEYHMGQLDVPDGGAKPGVEPGVETEVKGLVVPDASAILAKTPTTSSGKTIQNEIQGLTNELEEFGQTKAGQRLVTFENIENEFKDLSIGDKKPSKYKFGDPRINFKWDDEKKLLIPMAISSPWDRSETKRNISKMGILSETVFTHYKNSNKEYKDLRKRWKAAKTELEEKPWYKTKGAHLRTTSENRVVLELEEEMKQMEMQLLKEYQNKAHRYSTIYANHIKGKKSDYKNYKNKVAQLKYKTKEYNRREK